MSTYYEVAAAAMVDQIAELGPVRPNGTARTFRARVNAVPETTLADFRDAVHRTVTPLGYAVTDAKSYDYAADFAVEVQATTETIAAARAVTA